MKKGAPAADVSTTVVSTVSANNSGFSPVPSAEVQKKAASPAPQAQYGQSASAVSSDASVEVKEMDRVTSHHCRPYGDVEKGFSACD